MSLKSVRAVQDRLHGEDPLSGSIEGFERGQGRVWFLRMILFLEEIALMIFSRQTVLPDTDRDVDSVQPLRADVRGRRLPRHRWWFWTQEREIPRGFAGFRGRRRALRW